ncbi:MAG: hypothetical protein AAF357_05605 [Verrucomicrobiota bacterium]
MTEAFDQISWIPGRQTEIRDRIGQNFLINRLESVVLTSLGEFYENFCITVTGRPTGNPDDPVAMIALTERGFRLPRFVNKERLFQSGAPTHATPY